jgi:hypothetical protein
VINNKSDVLVHGMGKPRVYGDIEGLAATKTVSDWLSGLAEGESRRGSLYRLARYARWRKKEGLSSDPDEWIVECLGGTNSTLAAHAQDLRRYLERSGEFKDLRKATPLKSYGTVRGFYERHLVPLPRARPKVGNGLQSAEVEVEVTAMTFLGYFRRVLEAGHLTNRDRALELTMLQGAMDASTLTKVYNFVAYPQFVVHFGSEDPEEWDTGHCPVRIDLVRMKSDYRYYVFEDVDAIDATKVLLRERGPLKIYDAKPGLLAKSDPIFVQQGGEPIDSTRVTRVFCESGMRAGVNVSNGEVVEGARNRYPFHSHECRDTIITLTKRARADPVAAQWFTGHSIDKLKYDKSPWDYPEYYRDEYLKLARPYLNPVSGKVLEVEEKITKRFEERLSRLEKEISERLSAQT